MHTVLELLNNDAILTVIGLVFGFVIKDHPALAKVPNAAIPYVNAILALLVKLSAASAGVAPATYAAGMDFASVSVPTFVGTALAAGWQAIVTSLIYEFFIRNPKAAVFPPNPNAPRP